MTWIGDNSIELVEPTVPDGGPARMLARNGPGVFCLALQVADIAETAAWFDDLGVSWVGDVKSKFLFTHPRDTAGIYLEWAQIDRSEWEPRLGAKIPPVPGQPLIDVLRIDHWGALVDDPEATFDRLQQLWPAPVLWQSPGRAARPPLCRVLDRRRRLRPLPRSADRGGDGGVVGHDEARLAPPPDVALRRRPRRRGRDARP